MNLKQIAFLSLLSVAILCGVYFASTSLASPTCQSGTNCAAINVEPNTWNVTIGSSTVTSSARLYLVPMASTHTAITADGIIKVRVGGITYPDGNTQTVAFTGSGMTPAANISQGAFTNGGAGGNFAFQSGLAIGTTTYATLPQTLSVYGGGYFSGNVGIGTTNPGTKLHLRGTQGNLVVNTESVTNSIAIEAFNDGNTVKYPILLNPWGGNVGIGVTSPSGKLEIGGTEAADEPRLIFAASDASDRFTIKTDLDAITSNDFLGFRSVEVDNILVLKGNGNVGIGTTTPAYKLDVVGQINSSGGLCIAGDCKTSWSQVGGSSQWTNTTGGIYYLGNVGIGTSAVSYPLFVSTSTDTLFAIQRTGASSPTIFKQDRDSTFVINNGGSDILTIKSGNVGIGTTGPNYKLDVLDSSALVTYPLRLNNAYGGTTDLDQVGIMFSVHDGRPFATITGGQQNSGTYAYGRLDFGTRTDDTNGIQTKMSILSNGNVGIGITTPETKLHVEGKSIFHFDDWGNDAIIIRGQKSGSPNNWGEYAIRPSYLGMEFRNTQSGVTMLFMGQNGNVGIGTTTPAYKLDVASGGSVTARFGTASSDTVVIGGGAGKINVGTVDPIYSIGGKKYATYGPESIGIKISHSDLIKLIRNGKYSEAKLDFKNAKEGSDLWLFSKTTNLIKNFNKLSIQLTPSFIGKVWYSKDKENMAVKIYAIPDLEENNDLEVTYTLTAPRFDADSWGNYSNDDVDGFIIND